MGKILVIDDDKNICQLLSLYLQADGHEVMSAFDGSTGLDLFRSINPDLLILDIMLPLINGWEICRMVRRESDIPILMLTARDNPEDKVTGLDSGADDYVIKPFDPREVAARVRALLRRTGSHQAGGEQQVVTLPGLSVDMDRYVVMKGETRVEMKPKEIQLLHFLITNRDRVFSREMLLDKVWGYDYAGGTRTVDVHIKRIREKLEDKDSRWHIKTIWGVGYKLEVSDEERHL